MVMITHASLPPRFPYPPRAQHAILLEPICPPPPPPLPKSSACIQNAFTLSSIALESIPPRPKRSASSKTFTISYAPPSRSIFTVRHPECCFVFKQSICAIVATREAKDKQIPSRGVPGIISKEVPRHFQRGPPPISRGVPPYLPNGNLRDVLHKVKHSCGLPFQAGPHSFKRGPNL